MAQKQKGKKKQNRIPCKTHRRILDYSSFPPPLSRVEEIEADEHKQHNTERKYKKSYTQQLFTARRTTTRKWRRREKFARKDSVFGDYHYYNYKYTTTTLSFPSSCGSCACDPIRSTPFLTFRPMTQPHNRCAHLRLSRFAAKATS